MEPPQRQHVHVIVDSIESRFFSDIPRQTESEPSEPGTPPPPGIPAHIYHGTIPKSPPPGLVRVYSPTITPTRIIGNDQATLFGDFASYIEAGVDENGSPVIFNLICTICQSRKLIARRETRTPSPYDLAEYEGLSVLPCGHYFGSECIAAWMHTCMSLNSEPSCPLCRFQLVYSCGHDLDPRDLDPTRGRREQIPLTFPEGGTIPMCCEFCLEEQIWLMHSALQKLLFPRDLPYEDIVSGDWIAALRSELSYLEDSVWYIWGLRKLYNRW
ncbi:hypothetical protein GGS21DRAFT_542845 [Xylaria nigripes]|nr:hypothetical protein GGS21DRAFT_542845 [Xylaria nigripes]